MICNRCSLDLSAAIKLKEMISDSHLYLWKRQHCQTPVTNANSQITIKSNQQPVRSANCFPQLVNSSQAAVCFKTPVAVSTMNKNDSNLKTIAASNNQAVVSFKSPMTISPMNRNSSNLKTAAPASKALTPPDKVRTIFKSPPAINIQSVEILSLPTRSILKKPVAQVKRLKLMNKENESKALQQLQQIKDKKTSPSSSIVKLQAPVRVIPQENGTETVRK